MFQFQRAARVGERDRPCLPAGGSYSARRLPALRSKIPGSSVKHCHGCRRAWSPSKHATEATVAATRSINLRSNRDGFFQTWRSRPWSSTLRRTLRIQWSAQGATPSWPSTCQQTLRPTATRRPTSRLMLRGINSSVATRCPRSRLMLPGVNSSAVPKASRRVFLVPGGPAPRALFDGFSS